MLCPDADATVDVELFENLARRALVTENVAATRQAVAVYGGELLPHDRYEVWAEQRREQLRLRHLDLLRLDGRRETVVELDASDEHAHLAISWRGPAD
jgi:DNA-binding SARP family transcriptional activator